MEIISFVRGSTYTETLLWLADNDAFLTATSATMAAPVQITVTSHGLLTGQPVTLECVSPSSHPLNGWEGTVEVVDANTLLLPSVNGHCYAPVVGSFVIRYGVRFDLTGYTGRMVFRDRTGAEILVLTTDLGGGLEIDPASYEIAITVTAEQTQAFPIGQITTDLDLTAPDGTVTQLLNGVVVEEVTV